MTGAASPRAVVPLLEGLAAVAIWGASFMATKVAVGEVAPVTVVWVRFAMGVVVLAAAVAARGEFQRPSPKALGIFALLGVQGISLHQWLQSQALVTSQASTSGWIIASTPVCIAVLATLVLREPLTALQVGGVVLAAVGVALVVTRGDLSVLLGGRLAAPGDILIVLSAPNWAIFSVASRGVLRRHPAARMMLFVMLSGWLATSAHFLIAGGFGELGQLSVRGWAALVFLGVFCSGLAYIFWYDALRAMPAGRVGALLYLEPLVAQAVASALLGEALQPATLAGGAVILLGVWLVTGRRADVNRPAALAREHDRR